MSRRARFEPYKPRQILNKHRRPDHWFWARYTAYPYLGCQHGCEFCYCREQKYSPHKDPCDFAYVIRVKENASELLRTALGRAKVDLICTGDYQPAERKFCISRRMLEVCRDLGFPVFTLERSPLILRDLDVLQDINSRAPSVIAFSGISAPESPNAAAIRRMEHLAPPPEKRFAAMQAFAASGFLTGTCFMPILPDLCDDDSNLEAVVRATADHGGKFVLAGSLTLADQQRQYFLGFLADNFPHLLQRYEALYPPGSYGPQRYAWPKIARRIRELCAKYGIRDRIPRPIIPGEKHALNKRIVEVLAEQIYALEIDEAPNATVWALRKAGWAIEDLEQDLGMVYRAMGLKGLQSIPSIGTALGKTVEGMLLALGQEKMTAPPWLERPQDAEKA